MITVRVVRVGKGLYLSGDGFAVDHPRWFGFFTAEGAYKGAITKWVKRSMERGQGTEEELRARVEVKELTFE